MGEIALHRDGAAVTYTRHLERRIETVLSCPRRWRFSRWHVWNEAANGHYSDQFAMAAAIKAGYIRMSRCSRFMRVTRKGMELIR